MVENIDRHPNITIESPASLARRLVCETGAARDKQQYELVLLAISPLQHLWEAALSRGRLNDFKTYDGRIKLLHEAKSFGIKPMRVFAHGAGGSGKTYCITKVIVVVYETYLPGHCRMQASQNSAARLLRGNTMHAAAGLVKGAPFTDDEPSNKICQKLAEVWDGAAFVFNDEIGAAAPCLYATLDARAFWGRQQGHHLNKHDRCNMPFGDPMLQIDAGDFCQLKPVPRGSCSLMEAFLYKTTGYADAERAKPLGDMERKGIRTFEIISALTVEFQGTYRFKPGDPLVKLLQIMRTPGGKTIPPLLKQQIQSRIRCGSSDPRAQPTYRMPLAAVNDACTNNNCCNGMFSAVNWEQVSRLQHICILRNARQSLGCSAERNTAQGKPRWRWTTFCPYLNKASLALATIFARVLGRLHGSRGQLICFAQRVDRPHMQQYAGDVNLLRHALQIVNMTETAKLMGFCGLYKGMSVKITHKIMPPDIVQEATAEVVDIGFHEEEMFGMPQRSHQVGTWPAATHPCWDRGWVQLDRLPRWVALRMHGEREDYTGTGKPGYLIMEPVNGEWEFKYQATGIINHPNAKPVLQKAAKTTVAMTSSQLPLAPAGVGTFNNCQGKTARDEIGVPMGHTVDLKLTQRGEDDWAHYYMILGRATSLSTTLLLNFPRKDNNDLDWSIFEGGPPQYMLHVFENLKQRYAKTQQTAEMHRKTMTAFPPYDRIPVLHRSADNSWVYTPSEWDAACGKASKRGAAVLTEGMSLRERLAQRLL